MVWVSKSIAKPSSLITEHDELSTDSSTEQEQLTKYSNLSSSKYVSPVFISNQDANNFEHDQSEQDKSEVKQLTPTQGDTSKSVPKEHGDTAYKKTSINIIKLALLERALTELSLLLVMHDVMPTVQVQTIPLQGNNLFSFHIPVAPRTGTKQFDFFLAVALFLDGAFLVYHETNECAFQVVL